MAIVKGRRKRHGIGDPTAMAVGFVGLAWVGVLGEFARHCDCEFSCRLEFNCCRRTRIDSPLFNFYSRKVIGFREGLMTALGPHFLRQQRLDDSVEIGSNSAITEKTGI